MDYCHVEFCPLDADSLRRTKDIFALMRAMKSGDVPHDEAKLTELLGPRELSYFWNPTPDELTEWNNHWASTPVIARDSVLRHLPPTLDRRQALFLDGIRHAAEIADLAYRRLKSTLTSIALEKHEGTQTDFLFTSAFLDAWAVVDAIDRFRALWALLPDPRRGTPPPGTRTFAEISQPIRNLRNVADHLAQRADYVVAHKGSALGTLSWFTLSNAATFEGVICTIVPGTLQPRSTRMLNPAGRDIELPSGMVELSAGEHTAILSDVLPEMEIRIRDLEAGVRRSLDEVAANHGEAGADLLIKLEVRFHDPASPAVLPEQ